MLARLTAWLEGESGGTATFADFVERNGKDPFEIEHIWANHPEFHPEFDSEQAFADQRNKFGALLLLPRSFNASYGDKPYSENCLTTSGTTFLPGHSIRAVTRTSPFPKADHRAEAAFPGVPRRPHRAGGTATAAALPGDVRDDLGPGEAGPECSRSSRSAGVLAAALRSLVPATCRRPSRFPRRDSRGFPAGQQWTATVTADGRIRLDGGGEFDSPSGAAIAALRVRSWNRWDFWRIVAKRPHPPVPHPAGQLQSGDPSGGST